MVITRILKGFFSERSLTTPALVYNCAQQSKTARRWPSGRERAIPAYSEMDPLSHKLPTLEVSAPLWNVVKSYCSQWTRSIYCLSDRIVLPKMQHGLWFMSWVRSQAGTSLNFSYLKIPLDFPFLNMYGLSNWCSELCKARTTRWVWVAASNELIRRK